MRQKTLLGGVLSLLVAISVAAGETPNVRLDLYAADNLVDSSDDAARQEPSSVKLDFEPWTVARVAFPGYTIRRTVPEVRLQFSVTDEAGRLMTAISPDDVRIFDNQAVIQKIRQFARLQDLPLQLGIIVDVSDSVQKTVWHEKVATRYFVQQVLRPQADRASLMALSRDLKVWMPSTGDTAALKDALELIQPVGHITNLYDGLIGACARQFPLSGSRDMVQRIVVLFSDGEDTGSLHGMPEVIALAQRSEIQIFALSIHTRRKFTPGDVTLRRLADETGGQFYIAASDKEFPSIFAAMEQQMRTQYSISYQAKQETAGFHSLRLELIGSQKVHVHARQGYYFDGP